MFYVFKNLKTRDVYGNFSKNPLQSIYAHIRRANNPASNRYNTLLRKNLREHFNDFTWEIYMNKPDFIEILLKNNLLISCFGECFSHFSDCHNRALVGNVISIILFSI